MIFNPINYEWENEVTTPMQRTRKLLKEDNLPNWIVEHWNKWSKTRTDLFNIVDVLVLSERTLGIQVCGSDYQSHVKKIRESEYTIPWLEAKNQLQIWSWRQWKKKRGMKAKKWVCCVADISLKDGEIYVEELWK